MKAVIFDMDGLMFDTESLVVKGWDYAGEKLGVGKLGYMVNKTLGVNHEKTKEIFYEDFKDAVDVEKLTEITREYVYAYYDKYGTPEIYTKEKMLKKNDFDIDFASTFIVINDNEGTLNMIKHSIEFANKELIVIDAFDKILF